MSAPQVIAAFFDLDGTLLRPPSLEWRFISYLLWRDKLSTSNILRWLAHVACSIPSGPRREVEANKQYLSGLPASLAAEWADSLGTGDSSRGSLEIFDEGLKRIQWHQTQNHRVFIVSGSLAPLAIHVASLLPGKVEAIATELAVSASTKARADDSAPRGKWSAAMASAESLRSAIWTGELAGEHMVGAAKRRALQAIATRNHLDLTSCYAYGDSIADGAMLDAVGHPEAVNPSRLLARLARKQNWPASRWSSVENASGKPSPRSMTSESLRGRAAAEPVQP